METTKKSIINLDDEITVVCVYQEDYLKREIENDLCSDKNFITKQRVFSFLYRYNYFNLNNDYVYAYDNTDKNCIKFVLNMSQMFRDNTYLYDILLSTFSDDDFEDLFYKYSYFTIRKIS